MNDIINGLRRISKLEVKCSNAWSGGTGQVSLIDLAEIGKIARTLITILKHSHPDIVVIKKAQ